ncbi:histone deacetylase family protein [Rhizomonospora bruguierae]|uniref:histone deacetylase family protein n=1 Tax=Rhizomonospora bruguierae TaxID=1581705 RepID=UPI001BCC7508|nr:histone deacetylase family protein [Micromonospora sp. NBRC 107566]
MLELPAVWSPECLTHAPEAEIWVGVRTPGTEVPQRATVLRDAVAAAGARLVAATRHPDDALRAVHDAGLLGHLASVHDDWVAAGFDKDPGQDRVVPYVFPTPAMLDGLPARDPAAVHARAGRYCYDTMTLVGPGTWTAARAAVDAALTAADLVAAGGRAAYAICRPPGHHATPAGYGGSCYLNNAAVAAQALRFSGAARVAVIDIDAHHGNGTQAIFYERGDVTYGSVHVDPGAGWFPHYAGFADETGRGAGAGANRNVPIPPGTGDAGWLEAVTEVCVAAAAHRPEAVVLSLGVDAAAGDPESPLLVTREGYAATGALIRDLGVPVVAVHEGGYHLPTLGDLTVAVLSAL